MHDKNWISLFFPYIIIKNWSMDKYFPCVEYSARHVLHTYTHTANQACPGALVIEAIEEDGNVLNCSYL
jgi:hypothetical protein